MNANKFMADMHDYCWQSWMAGEISWLIKLSFRMSKLIYRRLGALPHHPLYLWYLLYVFVYFYVDNFDLAGMLLKSSPWLLVCQMSRHRSSYLSTSVQMKSNSLQSSKIFTAHELIAVKLGLTFNISSGQRLMWTFFEAWAWPWINPLPIFVYIPNN